MSTRSISWRLLWPPLLGLVAAILVPVSIARAHEIRPAYLQIDEVGPARYQLLWRTPVLSGMRLPVVLRLPDDVHRVTAPVPQELPDSIVERSVIDGGAGGWRASGSNSPDSRRP
jgi:hypothetical protein